MDSPSSPSIFVITAIAIFGLSIASISRRWDSNENVLMNISTLAHPLAVPSIATIFDKPIGDQQSFITKYYTSFMEYNVATESRLRRFAGNEVADASFSPGATKIANFDINRSTSSNNDDNATIPVTCACSHDASDNDARLPMILFFHSGGLIAGSVKAELSLARYLASKIGAVVCSVEYRLAPINPFPAGLTDAVDASVTLISSAAGGGDTNLMSMAFGVDIDVSRVATFGQSAGGYLSAHVARILTEKGHDVALQVSLVPMVKPPHAGTRSQFVNWHAPFWNGLINAYAWSVYLPGDDGSLSNDYRVSLLADPPNADIIDRLPPVYLQINTKDVLRDEGEMYARRLQKQGKLLGLDEYNTNHVGGIPGQLSKGGPGEEAFSRAVEIVKRKLHNVS